jgi:hypothetical protein
MLKSILLIQFATSEKPILDLKTVVISILPVSAKPFLAGLIF